MDNHTKVELTKEEIVILKELSLHNELKGYKSIQSINLYRGEDLILITALLNKFKQL